MERRRVVVTGVGVVSAAGVGVNDFWKGLGVAPSAGSREVLGWDPEPWIPKREHRRMDRFTQFALVATMEALEQSGGLDHVDPNRVTVGVATGIGGLPSLEELIYEAYTENPRPSPMLIPMMMCNAAAATISIHYGFGGQATTPVVACAAGGQAIMDTLRQIQWGYADAGIAGGAEGAVREPTIAGFRSARALSPSMIARPFDGDRDGFVLGEGAGILVLEEREIALRRGAPILAEILGAAATADAHHITAPHPGGEGAERAVRLAMADAGIEPDRVGYVNAHGTGTELNDRTEGEVVARIWGDDQPAISSIKGTTGHALGASGAIEAVASTLAIERNELPPNVGMTSLDPDIPLTDIVTSHRQWTPSAVVSNSFGFGGHNTAVVIGPAN
ncbi:MAG: beta-ketoacyl-[acyl-carrier-protein] synthase family protein [Acidimicrobiia bacterium]